MKTIKNKENEFVVDTENIFVVDKNFNKDKFLLNDKFNQIDIDIENDIENEYLGGDDNENAMYPESLNFAKDYVNLLSRKEFQVLKLIPNEKEDDLQGQYLRTASHQQFVQNFMNPNTAYHKILLMHGTGTGKTRAAISIATEYISRFNNVYRAMEKQIVGRNKQLINSQLDRITPSVFVLGFGATKTAFIRDLMNTPEYGFVNEDEIIEIENLRKSSGINAEANYRDIYNSIRRRITQKNKGGFYKFYGYREFVNRLFIGDIDIIAIEEQCKNDNIDLYDHIQKLISERKIKIGEIANMMNNCLLICDEAHNTYNQVGKNSYGVAIQWLIDHVSLRLVLMSATPINGSPGEVADILNYLKTKTEPMLTREQIATPEGILTNDALETIKIRCQGRISFLVDSDIKYYPSKEFIGESVSLQNSEKLPYLKFVDCELSSYQRDLLSKIVTRKEIMQICDTSFPQPNEINYLKQNIVSNINSATEAWRTQNQIYVRKNNMINIVSGSYLREKLKNYSGKFSKMMEILIDICKNANGDPLKMEKVMLFHPHVRGSGVLHIAEILTQWGFVEGDIEPTKNSVCGICGQTLENHTTEHLFIAARFIVLHGEIDETTLQKLMQKYNSPENRNGHKIMIAIGSKKIKEGYDFKEVRNQIILQLSNNISTMIQIFGRCVRKFSHLMLPPSMRNVKIYILISGDPEKERWLKKLKIYQNIQKVENVLAQWAVDSITNENIIKKALPLIETIGVLPFTQKILPNNDSLSENETTFYAWNHGITEIKIISFIIRRLFSIQPVWEFDTLFANVRNPSFSIEYKTDLISKENFCVALHFIVSHRVITTNKYSVREMFNPLISEVWVNGQVCKIVKVGIYYVAFPLKNNRPIVDAESYIRPFNVTQNININIPQYIKNHILIKQTELQLNEFLENKNTTLENGWIFNQTIDFQRMFCEYIIVHKNDKSLMKFPFTKLFLDIGILLKPEIISKDIWLENFDSQPTDNYPCAYQLNDTIVIYHNDKWVKVNKRTCNINDTNFTESQFIAYYEIEENSCKFKIRGGISHIKKRGDNRTVHTGVVCSTKPKNELIKIFKFMGGQNKITNIKNICLEIIELFIFKEVHERVNKTNMKYLYGWWNTTNGLLDLNSL